MGSEALGEMSLPYQGFSVYVVRSVLFSWYLGAMSYLGRPHSVLEICESIVSSSSSMILFMSIKSVPLLRRSSSRISQME